MKSKIVLGIPRAGEEKAPEYENFTFIRAMLGLADHYEFRDDMRNNDNGKELELDKRGNPKHIKEEIRFYSFEGTKIVNGKAEIPLDSIKNNNSIDRFRSPVSIRIFDGRMYFLMENNYKKMVNRIFVFLNSKKIVQFRHCKSPAEKKAVLESCPYISTPTEFDSEKFMSGFVEYFESQKEKLGAFYQAGRPDELSGSRNLVLNKGEAGNE